MAVKSILTSQTDFTGEFPYIEGMSGLWRFNESEPDADDKLIDSSGNDRKMTIINWSGTTASLKTSQKGRQFRMNINNPTTEKTHLQVTNDGSIFANIGERIVVGGWMNPTTYSVGNTFCPIFNTRYGPGQPILYLSLYSGKPRIMLYNSSGFLILDKTVTPSFSLVNGGWYFIAGVIEPNNKKFTYVLGDRDSGEVFISDVLTFTGDLNTSCTADLIMGMHADTYYYAGGFDDWFLDCDSDMTAADLAEYFLSSLCANAGDMSENVDGLTEPGAVTLRATDGVYPESGQLTTIPALCALSGSGRVSVTSEYTAGVNAISLVETSTSQDLVDWSAWQSIGTSGELQSPNQKYIRFRITLTTTDTSKTPKVTDIQLHDIPKAPYECLGFARPVILNKDNAWEAVLENAFDIIVTSEVKDYVQDTSYTDEIRISTLDCSNFTNPYQMLEYTQNKLEEYAHPRISYVLSAMDLSVLTGYEHEAWALGDIVTVDDKDLKLSVKTRVVRRQYNLQEPWNTVLELSTTLRELGDSSAQWDKAADVLASTDVIDRQEVKDLVPFNHLRNSRGDSGLAYWVNSGFEVDATNGVSGTASFKAEGEFGMTKSMMQIIYPANRSSYTFSAQIASENLKKGPAGQVGIEVVFEYEDGSTETRFIDLF